MERRHTPGPWGDQNKTVLIRGATWLGHANWDDAEAKANARLIAAAPDLLDVAYATRKLVSEAASVGFNYTDGDWADRIYANQARLSAAIAKAEGRA